METTVALWRSPLLYVPFRPHPPLHLRPHQYLAKTLYQPPKDLSLTVTGKHYGERDSLYHQKNAI